jgi:hypothetical protein
MSDNVHRATGSASVPTNQDGSPTLDERLKQVAAQEAYSIELSALEAQEERLRLQTRLAFLEAQLQEANLAPGRLVSFQPKIDGHLQCPRCWIAQKTRSVLAPSRSADRQRDLLRCEICHLEISSPRQS